MSNRGLKYPDKEMTYSLTESFLKIMRPVAPGHLQCCWKSGLVTLCSMDSYRELLVLYICVNFRLYSNTCVILDNEIYKEVDDEESFT